VYFEVWLDRSLMKLQHDSILCANAQYCNKTKRNTTAKRRRLRNMYMKEEVAALVKN